MRLSFSNSKNSKSLYVIKDVTINNKRSTKVVEKLGTLEEVTIKTNGMEPILWARQYVKELNRLEKVKNEEIIIKCSTNKLIKRNQQNSFNVGYLFLDSIYHKLDLHKICDKISNNNFEYDLNSILSRLIYSRILTPSSKLSTFNSSKNFIEQPNFDLHHIYRALSVIADNDDFIQSSLYNNSLKIVERNTNVLYYDCTNFFFEIEEASGIKQYGHSKENRPNPIVQMGLFMDGNGIPLAFTINSGNTNEQTTLKPIESKIIKDFELSQFVVCTDAGLASNANRKFNDIGNRAFITTQSIKKLKSYLKEWALSPTDWKKYGSDKLFDISTIDEESEYNTTYYKERWINENGLEQKLIVTYSTKYKKYQRKIRNAQIERAIKKIENNPSKLKTASINSSDRFIKQETLTQYGEVTDITHYSLDNNQIEKEESFDGFYAVCTNLESDPNEIIKINHRRWEVEECFRIMKHEFEARPVYLSRDDRIKAHFMTCFIALLIFRILEKQLDEEYSCVEIIDKLKEMNMYIEHGDGYRPAYIRDNLTDLLHETFNFRTDYQITTTKKMKEIIRNIKK